MGGPGTHRGTCCLKFSSTGIVCYCTLKINAGSVARLIRNTCSECVNLGFNPRHHRDQVWWFHTSNLNTREVEAGGSEGHGLPQLRDKFEISPDYVSSQLKIK